MSCVADATFDMVKKHVAGKKENISPSVMNQIKKLVGSLRTSTSDMQSMLANDKTPVARSQGVLMKAKEYLNKYIEVTTCTLKHLRRLSFCWFSLFWVALLWAVGRVYHEILDPHPYPYPYPGAGARRGPETKDKEKAPSSDPTWARSHFPAIC